MDRMIYTAMNGAAQSFDQQAVVSNNMANVSTPGFRAQLQTMTSIDVRGDGNKTRALAVAATTGADFTPGTIQTTGRDLDVAMKGNAFLALQTGDGGEAYTRRGDIQVDQNGLLSINGLNVMGDNGPLSVPLGSQVHVGETGIISVIEEGLGPETIAEVGRLKMVTGGPADFDRGLDGLFRAKPNAQGVRPPLEADEDARLISGAIEGSNVSATESMVQMIEIGRRYEMQMKGISSASENASRANSLLTID